MRIFLVSVFAAFVFSASASAQQLIGGYYTVLGQQDHFNSRGSRLTDIGSVLQQDRANYHRFGIPNVGDEGDPFFWDANQRARIPSIWRPGDGFQFIIDSASPSFPTPVYVQIYGFGDRVSYIVVSFGAG